VRGDALCALEGQAGALSRAARGEWRQPRPDRQAVCPRAVEPVRPSQAINQSRRGTSLTLGGGPLSSDRTLRQAVMSTLSRAVLTLLACFPVVTAAQVQHVVIRGRVTTDSGRAIPNASVVITRTADRSSRRAQSDARGDYAIDWPGAEIAYTLVAQASGFQQY